jgi:uncharacterized protein YecT (DUF1311 family)
MMRKHLIVFLAAATLSACDSLETTSGECGSEDTKSLAIRVLKDGIEDEIASARDENGSVIVARSKIRAALKDVEFVIKDIRTTRRDPDSSARFCTGVVSIRFAQDVLKDAEETSRLVSYVNLEQMAQDLGFDRSANAFTIEIDYNVQPTDDNEKIFVEVDNGDPIVSLGRDIISAHLLHAQVTAESAIQAAEAKRLAQEQEAASQEQQTAILEEANAHRQLSEQSINAVWQALDPATRDELLQVQRAWIRRKTAECKLEGASESTDESARRAATAYCEARMNNEREQWLREYLSYEY